MSFSIYFCSDGVLRTKSSEHKTLLPLKFIQENSESKDNDLRFFAKWWNYPTFFEEGLTLMNFFKCLEPWATFWSDLTGKDIIRYIQEIKKPYLVQDNTTSDNLVKIDWLELSHNIFITLDSKTIIANTTEEHSKNIPENDLSSWIKSEKQMQLTGKWRIKQSFTFCGFIKEKQGRYSTIFTPINEIANVPLVLNHNIVLQIAEQPLVQYYGEQQASIFQAQTFGIANINGVAHIIGHTNFSLKEIIEEFFKSAQLDYKNQLEQLYNFESFTEINTSPEQQKNNVIDLFKNPENKELSNKTQTKVTVLTNPNFINHQLNEENQLWEYLQKKASRENIITRIGEIAIQTPFENRFNGNILDETNSINLPLPTE